MEKYCLFPDPFSKTGFAIAASRRGNRSCRPDTDHSNASSMGCRSDEDCAILTDNREKTLYFACNLPAERHTLAINAPGLDFAGKQLEDIAIFVNGKLIAEDRGTNRVNGRLSALGPAKKVMIEATASMSSDSKFVESQLWLQSSGRGLFSESPGFFP
jgi:hypothetical protein